MASLVRSLQTQNLSPNLRLRWAANQKADAMCISQTPAEALKREWAEHGIDRYVKIIAGQEMGTKTEHLKFAAAGKYGPNKILMIGDALGDFKAAKSNNALFFRPILATRRRRGNGSTRKGSTVSSRALMQATTKPRS